MFIARRSWFLNDLKHGPMWALADRVQGGVPRRLSMRLFYSQQKSPARPTSSQVASPPRTTAFSVFSGKALRAARPMGSRECSIHQPYDDRQAWAIPGDSLLTAPG
jgi:hypothetical protein